jgi:hypothetical protein
LRKASTANSKDLSTNGSCRWIEISACQRATRARVGEVTDVSTCCTQAGRLGSHCPDSLFIRISVASHDIKRIGTYLCWRSEGRNNGSGCQAQATASRRQLVCREGRQSRNVDTLFKRFSRLCTIFGTLVGVLNAVDKITAAYQSSVNKTLPLSGCGGRRRDGPGRSVRTRVRFETLVYSHSGCWGCGHACDSCWDVKVRATESCRWRPQRFEYSQCEIDGFAVDSTFLEVEVQGVGNGTGRSNCQSECESSEKMHCEGWYVTEFVGVGRVGGSFDNNAEFLMDCQNSLSSTIYYSASIGI